MASPGSGVPSSDTAAPGKVPGQRFAMHANTRQEAVELARDAVRRLAENLPVDASSRSASVVESPATVPATLREETVAALRNAGARFALLHGSRATGTHRPDSDVDVAAWWGSRPPASFEVDLPRGVDLVVLDTAPLELAGRIAVDGLLLFDDDPPARVRWVATTRKIWFDERPRFERAHREFLESLRRGR